MKEDESRVPCAQKCPKCRAKSIELRFIPTGKPVPRILHEDLGGDLTVEEEGRPTAARDCIWHTCKCGCQWASLTWKAMQ